MHAKLKALLARVILIGGVVLVVAYMSKTAPHDQTLVVRINDREISRVDVVVTRLGDEEASAGFSQDFVGGAPRVVRHTFSAPNGTYIVVITFSGASEAGAAGDDGLRAGDERPIRAETSFERRVSLSGGELIVSPD